jgi:hypothetical protein
VPLPSSANGLSRAASAFTDHTDGPFTSPGLVTKKTAPAGLGAGFYYAAGVRG